MTLTLHVDSRAHRRGHSVALLIAAHLLAATASATITTAAIAAAAVLAVVVVVETKARVVVAGAAATTAAIRTARLSSHFQRHEAHQGCQPVLCEARQESSSWRRVQVCVAVLGIKLAGVSRDMAEVGSWKIWMDRQRQTTWQGNARY